MFFWQGRIYPLILHSEGRLHSAGKKAAAEALAAVPKPL